MNFLSSTENRVPGSRPSALHSSKSFSRLEPSISNPLSRHRASTAQSGVIQEVLSPEKANFESALDPPESCHNDIFEKKDSEEVSATTKALDANFDTSPQGFPEGFDDLPIELISLTDR